MQRTINIQTVDVRITEEEVRSTHVLALTAHHFSLSICSCATLKARETVRQCSARVSGSGVARLQLRDRRPEAPLGSRVASPMLDGPVRASAIGGRGGGSGRRPETLSTGILIYDW